MDFFYHCMNWDALRVRYQWVRSGRKVASRLVNNWQISSFPVLCHDVCESPRVISMTVSLYLSCFIRFHVRRGSSRLVNTRRGTVQHRREKSQIFLLLHRKLFFGRQQHASANPAFHASLTKSNPGAESVQLFVAFLQMIENTNFKFISR